MSRSTSDDASTLSSKLEYQVFHLLIVRQIEILRHRYQGGMYEPNPEWLAQDPEVDLNKLLYLSDLEDIKRNVELYLKDT